MALESFKVLDTCRKVRIIERKCTIRQNKLFELRRFSSYGGSSNREFFMRVYLLISTVPEKSFELKRDSCNRGSSYREPTVPSKL